MFTNKQVDGDSAVAGSLAADLASPRLAMHTAGGSSSSMHIVVAIGKGGGGKTTTLANLATVAASQGLSIGLIDADPQASLCQWRGTRGGSVIKVVPCAESDDLVAKVEQARRSGIERLLIDTSPALGAHTLTAVKLADLVLVPTRPASLDLLVTRRRIELLRTMNRNFACVINAAPPRRAGIDAPFVRQTRDNLRDAGARPWVGQLTHRHSILHALIDGKGVVEIEPEGPAAHEFVRLWSDIEQHLSRVRHGRKP